MKILLATDGSAGALDAARFLSCLDARPETHVHLLTIQKEGAHGEVRSGAEAVLAATREALGSFAGQVTASSSETRCTTSGIVERIQVAAEMLPADIVVTGSRGQSPVARFFMGSVALGVVRHSPCSVLVGRTQDGPLTRVVVGVDGSRAASGVVGLLRRLPIPKSCAIQLVHVGFPADVATRSGSRLPASLRKEISGTIQEDHVRGQTRLAEAADALKAEGWSVTTQMRFGDPASELLAVVNGDLARGEYRADLLIVGARGENSAEKYFLGSVSSRVVEMAPSSVLLVR